MTDLVITGQACLVADCASLNPVNFVRLKSASWNDIKCEGVILRCTRSNGELDTQFGARFDAAKALGFMVGAYDFNTGEAAKVQAQRFIAATASRGAMLRALDYENNPSGGQMTLQAMLEWLDRVDQAFSARSWLYSGDRLKQVIVDATDAQRDFLSLHLLWGCEYGPLFKMRDNRGRFLPWPAPTLWQFTGDGVGPEPHALDGLELGADLSLFRGTRADLEKVWNGTPIVAPTGAPAIASAAPQSDFALWFDHLHNAV